MTDTIIKSVTSQDIPALKAVLDGTQIFPSEMLDEMLAPALAGETQAFWLACHLEGGAVGLCYTAPEALADGTWNMLALAVRPDMQGKGLGGRLVRAAELQLKGLGARILIVDTSGASAFEDTRLFYARNGYEEEARIRDFWAEGDDKVTFRKAL